MIQEWSLLAAKIWFWVGVFLLCCSPFTIIRSVYEKWKVDREKTEYDMYVITKLVTVAIRVVFMALLGYLIWWRV